MNKNLNIDYFNVDLITMNIIKNKIDTKHKLVSEDIYLLRLIFKHYAELIEKVYYSKE